LVVSDSNATGNTRHLCGTTLEVSQTALSVGFVLPRMDVHSVPQLNIGATIGAVQGQLNDIFVCNVMAIQSNLLEWKERMFGSNGEETQFNLQSCTIAGTPEHPEKIHLNEISFERLTAWTWHQGQHHAQQEGEGPGHEERAVAVLGDIKYIGLEKFVEPSAVHRQEKLWELDKIILPARVYSSTSVQDALTAAIKANAMDKKWRIFSKQLVPRAVRGELGLWGRNWGSGQLKDENIESNREQAKTQARKFEELCDAEACSAVEDWVYNLRTKPPPRSYADGIIALPGMVIGKVAGSEGQDAKWIWADKGRVGWLRLDSKHAMARATYSAWTRGTFAEIEADLRSKGGDDATRGVELRIKHPVDGEDRDVSFPTPLKCAEWIGRRRQGSQAADDDDEEAAARAAAAAEAEATIRNAKCKWIWADAGRIGMFGLDKKHALARLDPLRWKHGTFDDIEQRLRGERGNDANPGVELQIENPLEGEAKDMDFVTGPVACADWIQARQARLRRAAALAYAGIRSDDDSNDDDDDDDDDDDML
jgi:hypothetical protein